MDAELFLLTIAFVSFLAVLIGLTALLSIARQVRIQRMAHTVSTSVSIAVAERDTPPAPPIVPALEKPRQAMPVSASDAATLPIELESGPTHQQRPVQRLSARYEQQPA